MSSKNYRTKQESRNLTNPKGKNYIVAIDAGYSSMKVFWETGCCIFPSYAKKKENSFIDIMNEDDIFYKEDGSDDVYIIGKTAQNVMDDTGTNETESELYSRKRYSNKRFRILCNVALAEAIKHKKDNRKIVIQTGLPASYLNADTGLLKKAFVQNVGFSVKKGSGKWNHYKFEIKPDDVFVMSQPLGALYSYITKPDGKYTEDAKNILSGNVLVMDIGFGTLDLFGIQNREVKCKESVDDVGMKKVLLGVSKKILEETGEDIRVAALQKHLETGKILCVNEEEFTSEEKPIGEYLLMSSNATMHEAIDKMRNITSSLRGYNILIVDGGTGEAWYEGIKEKLAGMKTISVMPCNRNDHLPFSYSNVRGYYMFMYSGGKS